MFTMTRLTLLTNKTLWIPNDQWRIPTTGETDLHCDVVKFGGGLASLVHQGVFINQAYLVRGSH